MRVLGIMIDQHLNLDVHAATLKSKLASGIFSLKSLKGVLDKERLKLVYYAHFHSHLYYCSNIFSLFIKTLADQIFILQKKAIRIICNVVHLAYTQNLFKTEEILPFEKLILFNQLLFMYDYVNLRLV